MCHVSEFLVANRPFISPPPPGFAEPAEANLAHWYGLGEDEHSVLGCEARWFTSDHTRVTPKEAQDGSLRWRTQRGPASELYRSPPNRCTRTVTYVTVLTYGMYETF